MKYIDTFLNGITMYRLVVWSLRLVIVAAFALSLLGRLSFTPVQLGVSLLLLAGTSWLTDIGFSKIWQAPKNSESWLITALILFLILQPADKPAEYLSIALAGVIAAASKYVLAWNGKHIFNPAALAAAVMSLTTLLPTTWWVGSASLWPVTLVVGLAVVHKIRRFPLFLSFIVVSVVLQLVLFAIAGQPVLTGMQNALFASPLIFLGTIMLTEPATMPPRRAQQIIFGALVAVLYVFAWKFGPLYIYPEVALLLGNVYAFAVSPKFRLRLQLQEVHKISERVYEYVFQPDKPFSFLPGQYMEWTLAGVPSNNRGNRRTFTIASSPTESTVRLGVKYYNPSSSYKHVLSLLQPGATVYASQLAGSFTPELDAPGRGSEKLAFIAGGIGITPFRSMVQYIVDEDLQRDIVLLYILSDPEELAFRDLFTAAAQHGIKFVVVTTRQDFATATVPYARLGAELLKQVVPDYAERTFYISGASTMVDCIKGYLQQLGVAAAAIKTDHFSGY